MAVVSRLLLPAVHRTLGAVDIEDQTPRGRAGRLVLHQVRIEARESLIVPLLREDFGLEPVQGGRERNTGGNWRLRPVRGSVRCRSIRALRPRRSSNSRGSSSPASEVTVAPLNSMRRWG